MIIPLQLFVCSILVPASFRIRTRIIEDFRVWINGQKRLHGQDQSKFFVLKYNVEPNIIIGIWQIGDCGLEIVNVINIFKTLSPENLKDPDEGKVRKKMTRDEKSRYVAHLRNVRISIDQY